MRNQGIHLFQIEMVSMHTSSAKPIDTLKCSPCFSVEGAGVCSGTVLIICVSTFLLNVAVVRWVKGQR